MADEDLNVKITADASQATAGFNDVLVAASRLGTTMTATGASGERAGDAIAQAHAIAAGAAVRHAEAESILGASIGKVEIATNAAARAFGILGLESGEATERILMVTEALDALEASAGPILLLGGAFLAVGAAVNFVNEGIQNAAKEQREFVSMSTAIATQGDSWNEARESIEHFATTLSEATTFSKGEAIAAIDDLTSSGIRYADAEKLVAIATDVAAAKHVTLISVVDAIKEAEAGRAMGLVKLDVNLKGLIESHAHASVILNKLSSDMSGQAAAAAETLEGKEARLRNELELLATEIGTDLLPAIEHGVEFFADLTSAMERAGDAASRSGKLIADTFNLTMDTIALDPGAVGSDLKSVAKDFKPIHEDLAHWNNAAADMKKAREAWAKERSKLKATPWEDDPTLGRDQKPKKEKATHDVAPVSFDMIGDQSADKTDAVVTAQKRLDEQLKATTTSEDAYKLAVMLATTEADKNRAELALRTKVAADAAETSVRLGLQIANERTEIAKLTLEHTAAIASALHLSEAHDTLGKNLKLTQDHSKAAAARVAELGKEQAAAQKSATTLGTSIETLTQQMARNSDELARQPALAASNAIAQAALTKAYNDSRAAESEKIAIQLGTNGRSLEQERAYWTSRIATLNKGSADYLKKLAEFQNAVDETNAKISERDAKGGADDALATQKLVDEETTYKLSLGQQLAYYEQRYAQTVSADGQYSTEARALSEKINGLELDEYKQREDAHAAFLKNFQDGENTIIDGVIEKHTSMRDTLKQIWVDMVKNWEQSLEQMVEKSSILNNLNATIFKDLNIGGGSSGGGFGGGAQAAAEGVQSYGLLGILGKSGAQQVVSSIPTSSGILGSIAGSGFASDAGQADMSNSSFGSWADESGGGDPAAGGTGNSVANAGGIGGSAAGGNLIGSVAQGYGLGELGASITGGSSAYGGLGGALGGLLGTALHANPLIGAGIDLATGLIGSLFGNKVTAYKNPDIDDTQNYGQTIADLLGHAGANGQTFYEDSATKSAFGGGTAISGIEELLSQGKSAFETATGLGDDAYKAALADFGSSASGSGKLNFGKNIGDESITGAAGAGSTFRYTDAENIIAEIEKGLAGTGSSSIPTFSVTRTYGQNPNVTGLKADGTVTQTPTNVLTPAGNSSSTPAVATVNVTVNGNVVGPGGLSGVVKDIGVGLRRVNDGEISGGTSWQQKRFTGGS